MSAKLIDGKKVAEKIRAGILLNVQDFKRRVGRNPGLSVILVGENQASLAYVNGKRKLAKELGIEDFSHNLAVDTSEEALLDLIDKSNDDSKIDGILVQLPLPGHINEQKVIEAINPAKDVDGFHPYNAGRLAIGEPALVSCTPAGIIELIKSTGVEIKGKKAVVVGRSNIVGKPMAHLLLAENATVTICHSRTADLPQECRNADILVVAIGRKHMVSGDWIKTGAVVIDVGINRDEKGLCGDVFFEEAVLKAGFITPVPGGVGPMTITMLMSNTLKAAKKREGLS